MAKMYKVTVKGTGQLNGPVNINKTVEMEEQMAAKFNGANRYEVIEAFINTHYPGVKIQPRNFGANVVAIKSTSDKIEKSSKSSKSESQHDTDSSLKKRGGSALSSIGGIIGGAIAAASNRDDDADEGEQQKEIIDYRTEKEKIDLEYYRKQKEIEYEKQKHILHQQKMDSYKAELNNVGSIVKKSWSKRKKTWITVLVIIAVFYIVGGILAYLFLIKK
jgi:hypothetical protein